MSTLATKTAPASAPVTEVPSAITRHNRLYFFNDRTLQAGIESTLTECSKEGSDTCLTLRGPAGDYTGSFCGRDVPTFPQMRKKAKVKPEEEPGFALRDHILDALATAAARRDERLAIRVVIVFDTTARIWPYGSSSKDSVAQQIERFTELIDKAVAAGTLDFDLEIIGLSGTSGKVRMLLKGQLEHLPQNVSFRGMSVEEFLSKA